MGLWPCPDSQPQGLLPALCLLSLAAGCLLLRCWQLGPCLAAGLVLRALPHAQARLLLGAPQDARGRQLLCRCLGCLRQRGQAGIASPYPVPGLLWEAEAGSALQRSFGTLALVVPVSPWLLPPRLWELPLHLPRTAQGNCPLCT